MIKRILFSMLFSSVLAHATCLVQSPVSASGCLSDFTTLPVGASPRIYEAVFTPTADTTTQQVIGGYGSEAPDKLFGVFILNGHPYVWQYGANDFQCSAILTPNQQVKVTATYDGVSLSCLVNGQPAGSIARSLNTGSGFATVGNEAGQFKFAGTIQSISIGLPAPAGPTIISYGVIIKLTNDADGWHVQLCTDPSMTNCTN